MPDRALEPAPAETARTLLCGSGTASIRPWREGAPVCAPGEPVLHACAPDADDGRVWVLADAGAPARLGLPEAADGDAVAVLTVRSCAPLADRTLPRAVLEVAGELRRADPADAAEALELLAAGADLADLLTGWTRHRLLVLEVADTRLHAAGGCSAVDAVELALARPDPLARHEGEALERLRSLLGARLAGGLRRALPQLAGCADARPVGLDRYGLVVECSWDTARTALVRVPFPHPADDVELALHLATRHLLPLH